MSRDGKVDVYRVHAAQYVQLAQMTDDPENKAMLLNMAQSWHALARQHDRSCQTRLVYQTNSCSNHEAKNTDAEALL